MEGKQIPFMERRFISEVVKAIINSDLSNQHALVVVNGRLDYVVMPSTLYIPGFVRAYYGLDAQIICHFDMAQIYYMHRSMPCIKYAKDIRVVWTIHSVIQVMNYQKSFDGDIIL